MSQLLLATNNQGKVGEYRSLLNGLPFPLTTLREQGITTEVEEGGESLEENARLKATTLADESGLVTLADDSGLEVDALGGEPGPLSARYAGEGASDRDRVSYLLSPLNGVPWSERGASFCCVIALAIPHGEVQLCVGRCPGVIALEAKGEYGFGYDPVFFLPGLNKTMAELSPDVKNEISHRGQAARMACQVLQKPPFSRYLLAGN